MQKPNKNTRNAIRSIVIASLAKDYFDTHAIPRLDEQVFVEAVNSYSQQGECEGHRDIIRLIQEVWFELSYHLLDCYGYWGKRFLFIQDCDKSHGLDDVVYFADKFGKRIKRFREGTIEQHNGMVDNNAS